jgi:TolA-binding protein
MFKNTLGILVALSTCACVTTRAGLLGRGNAEAPTPMEPQPVKGNYEIEELRSELARLQGRIDEAERAIGNQERSLKDSEVFTTLEQRMTEMETSLQTTMESLKRLQSSIPATENKSAWNAGRKAFAASNWKEAIDQLSTYLQFENAKHAEEAYFLRGESYLKTNSAKKAILDFAMFPEKYQKSAMYPKAVLRIAESYEQLGNKADARPFYSEIVERFPKSPEAKTAKKRLK